MLLNVLISSSTEMNQLKFDIINLNSSSLWFTEQNDNGEFIQVKSTCSRQGLRCSSIPLNMLINCTYCRFLDKVSFWYTNKMARKTPWRLKILELLFDSYKLNGIISKVLYLWFLNLAIQFETVEQKNWELGESIK